MPDMIPNIDLTPIIKALVMLIAGLITYKLLPWIKARATTEQLEAMETATTILVFAAEQMYGAGKGAEKLDYVVKELEKRGFTADRAAIEATVKANIEELHKPKPTV